jgi:thiol-disulfide isomerase/thioredoxin
MLLLAIAAGAWARRSEALRPAVLILGAVTVFAVVSYGVEAVRHSGARAPATVTVDGKPYDIATGKVLVYFFNPACTHCFDAAKSMSKLEWDGARVVAVPVEVPQFGAGFLNDTGLRAVLTTDFEALRGPLGYNAYPYAVALVDGRQKASIAKMEGDEPAATLRALGFVR